MIIHFRRWEMDRKFSPKAKTLVIRIVIASVTSRMGLTITSLLHEVDVILGVN